MGLGRRLARLGGYRLLLLALIVLYTALFAGLAFAQHAGMRTHKADLGQIAQAVWNSSRGRFVEMTDNGFIATRMTDHVEPILALISPVLWVWDDVRALLLLQAAAVAIGAWPLYELALILLDRTLSPAARQQIWELEPLRQMTEPLALALAAAYLLAPQLQSALLTEFHAVPLVVPLVLWALWSVEAQRWRQFTLAVLLVAAVKEETALLAAGLALWGPWRAWISRLSADPLQGAWRITLLGGTLAVAALGWFYLATFVIVPAHAVEVYGVAESYYFRRYGALGDSPADILKSFFTQPALVWQIATEPARLAYLRDLVRVYGWLPLLAPDLLLLSAPVLLANQLSAYPAQYYGEFHYSAPVAVYFAAASAFGLARLWRPLARRFNRSSAEFQHMPAAGGLIMALVAFLGNSRSTLRPLLAAGLVLWLVGWGAATYAELGRGPGGGRYDPTPITAHHRLLARFTAQIPPDAAVTATAAVHPHVSHRRFVYQFPIGLEPPGVADWALLDVTTATDMAPGDVRATVEAMLAGEWGVVDGADGFLLLRKGAPDKTIPAAFYDFARTPDALPPTEYDHALRDHALALVSVTVDDWPRWRQTKVETVWQVGRGFDAASMAPQIELIAPNGERLYHFAQAMPPALVWYPPSVWQPGDVIAVTTLPLYLPYAFGVNVLHTPGLAAGDGWPAGQTHQLAAAYVRGPDGVLQGLDPAPAAPQAWGRQLAEVMDGAMQVTRARVADTDLRVTAWLPQAPRWPGAPVDVWLAWTGAAWPEGVEVFVHLRGQAGNLDQQDGLPRYLTLAHAPASEATAWADWRQLAVPPDYAGPDTLSVVIGLYHPATGERLAWLDEQGAPLGEEVVVGRVMLGDAPVPDQTCALIPATCASQVTQAR